MRTFTSWSLLLGAILATSAPMVRADKSMQWGDGPNGMTRDGKPVTRGWKSLFDGKTLNGWTRVERETA